ncbi:3-hydroxyisobutyrate dehydrogenase [Culex quinquefasciatus]|uniref:3-hydroxyisobutyrate dehydrogenase n=1 Tax=Culex quinquefasciatus TaxID=7176 RepID=B0XCQ3_CULQU|nr:3-hydroxyisobutyrate dehydrogenase [Culex quinquefasciatus]|eukprot:XP_001867425.1 3-hydroxyisobutyrate dehydrogenase [Culex quinquefasciatus]
MNNTTTLGALNRPRRRRRRSPLPRKKYVASTLKAHVIDNKDKAASENIRK